MQELILMVGNIGCGKSFLAKRLAKRGAIVVNNDNLLRMFSGGDYTYDHNLREFYHRAEASVIIEALNTGNSVVIDRTNLDKSSRARFIQLAKGSGAEVVTFDFGPGQDMQLQRRIDDPQGQTIQTWKSVYKSMKLRYEEPSHDEGIDRCYLAPKEFRFWAFDFDGTIVEHRFPDIGPKRMIIVKKIKRLAKDLSNVIIIWSCRSGDFENQMRDWLDDNNVYYDFINENPIFNIGTRKIFAHHYIDDRNIFFEGVSQCRCSNVDTDKVSEVVQKQNGK